MVMTAAMPMTMPRTESLCGLIPVSSAILMQLADHESAIIILAAAAVVSRHDQAVAKHEAAPAAMSASV
jgi:hypothetical protein